MAFMFSIARENSSNVLEFNPECIMREDLMSLSSKFPLIPGSQRSITFCTTCLSQKVSVLFGKVQMIRSLKHLVLISKSSVNKTFHAIQSFNFQTSLLCKRNDRYRPYEKKKNLFNQRTWLTREHFEI